MKPHNVEPRAWQRMLSGRRLDLLNPAAGDIEISDIAHGLARVARWNGQTTGTHALSVAEHCLIVEDITVVLKPDASTELRLMALLHDAPEYVIGDLISPFKAAIGLDYKIFENRLLAAIHNRFGLPGKTPTQAATLIKRADQIAAYFEATCLAGFSRGEAEQFFGSPADIPQALATRLDAIDALPTAAAHARFMQKFTELTESTGCEAK